MPEDQKDIEALVRIGGRQGQETGKLIPVERRFPHDQPPSGLGPRRLSPLRESIDIQRGARRDEVTVGAGPLASAASERRLRDDLEPGCGRRE